MKGVRGLVLLAFLAAPVAAQEPASRPAVASFARYAKWPTLAAAVGFTAVAFSHNRDADRVYDALTTYCFQNPLACNVVPVGSRTRYVEDDPERLYQETLRLDRQARNWLVLGQVSLAASGVMFLIDLISGDDGPDNIPFDGFRLIADGRRLGLRLAY